MPFDPSTLSGKILWLRGKDLGAGGTVVSSWPDQSGSGMQTPTAAGSGSLADIFVNASATPSGGKAASFSNGKYLVASSIRGVAAVVASSEYGGGLVATNLIDGNAATEWYTSATTATIRYQLAATFVATGYQLRTSPAYNAGQQPKDWLFQGSNDGSTWTTLDTVTGSPLTSSSAGVTHTFTMSNATSYLYYRLNVTANNGGSGLHLADMWVTGSGTTYPRSPLTTGAEAWVVVKVNSGVTRTSLWAFGTYGTYPEQYPFDGNISEDFGRTTRPDFTPTLALTSWRLYRIRNDTTTWQAWLDGVSQSTASGLAVGWASQFVIGAGRRGTGFDYQFEGQIAELLILERATDSTEASSLIGYFNGEHGLSVPGGVTPGAVSDTVGLTDSPTVARALDRTFDNPVGLLDTAAVTVAGSASPSDTVGITDTASGSITFVVERSLDDPTGITDSVSTDVATSTALAGSPADPVGITDTATPVLVAGGSTTTIDDGVSVTDTVDTATHSLGSVWLPYPVTDTGSQVLDFSIVPTSPEEPWPFPYEGDGYSNSLWLDFTASGTQTLTITLTTSFASGIEVWTGDVDTDPENDLSIEGYGQGTLAVAIAPGQHVYMRAHPLLDTQTTGTGTLTWSVADRPETGVLGFVAAAEVLETPGWIATSLLSAPPSSAVTFALDGGATFFTVTSEEDGTFEGAVELPDLPAGTHTLTATDVDGQTQTVSFTVLLDVPSDGTLPGSAGPATAPSPDPVIHWVLEDPMPGGLGTYTFPINPSEMSSPFPEKQLRPERTVHPSGQDVVWEGRPDPVDWSVKGTVLTEAFYDALTAYHALHRRLYVVDHHQRAWVVAFDNLTFEKKGRPDDWMHTYSAKFLILGGPVSLS